MNQYGIGGNQYGMNGYGQSMYPQMQNPYGINNVPYVSGVNWVQGVEADGCGYYEADVVATVEPTAVGNVTVALFENNVQIPGAIASGYAGTADVPVTLPIATTIRKGCNCDGASQIVLKLIEGPGNVTNVSTRVVKS